MNTDPFEDELKELPLRQVPPEWRADILRHRQSANDAAERQVSIVELWKRLLWPSPYAWSGIAAVWLLILGLNSFAPETSPSRVAKVEKPATAIMAAVKERALLRAELTEATAFAPPPAERPKPRSATTPPEFFSVV